MPAAYSTDIRGRVIASVESGSSRREAAGNLTSVRAPRSNGLRHSPNDWKLGGQAAGRERLTTGKARELFADAD